MIENPVKMEDYFSPGFKTKPALHVGSQDFPFWRTVEYQSWDGVQLAATTPGDLCVVRNIDKNYIDYWKQLIGDMTIINLQVPPEDSANYLTETILSNKKLIGDIRTLVPHNSVLMVFLPTHLEQILAEELNIPLHGRPTVSSRYGTKSGIRTLAQETGLAMTPGFICRSVPDVEVAARSLAEKFSTLVMKHDDSASGELSTRFLSVNLDNLENYLGKITQNGFVEGRDVVVVEGWVDAKASLCAHIEIIEGQKPIVCAGWQQVIDDDGISFMGAGPLRLSERSTLAFYEQAYKLGEELQKRGAVGSFGPDYLVANDGVNSYREDDVLLVELNARVPYTAYPLEIVKSVRGTIGSGFYSQHVHLPVEHSFNQVADKLNNAGILITEKDRGASGIVPYNVGPLPWGTMDIVAMADSWDETQKIASEAKKILDSDM